MTCRRCTSPMAIIAPRVRRAPGRHLPSRTVAGRSRGRRQRRRHVHRRRVSGQPGPHPALQPDRPRSGRAHTQNVPGALAERKALSSGTGQTPGEHRRGAWRCSWLALGTRSSCRRRRLARRAPTGSTSRCLQREVLGPLLKIGDVRTDKRIDFVGGIRGTAELERLVTSGQAAVAFAHASGRPRRPDGHRGRRGDHAAEVHLVRAQAPGRTAGA